MHNYTVEQAETLFNRIEEKKAEIIAEKLQDAQFVAQHFPYQERAARQFTSWMATLQLRLMEEFTA